MLAALCLVLPMFPLMMWATARNFEEQATMGAYLATYAAMYGVPVLMVWRHRRRQQRLIDRARAKFALGLEFLARGEVHRTKRLAAQIRRIEQRYAAGDSVAYRAAYGSWIIAIGFVLAAANHVLSIKNHDHNYRFQQKTWLHTFEFLQDHPLATSFITFLALATAAIALKHLPDLQNAPWREFYGKRLAEALRAGKGLAAHVKVPTPARAAATARELLGLGDRFTAAELRRAWLRLVRELHPDRFATAPTVVRQSKEAAMKRVNAARDELLPQAIG